MIVLILPDIAQEDRLLQRARQGDKVAVGQIYRNYVDAIYQFCRMRLSDAQQAEDITSTVFTTMITKFAQGKGPNQHLRGWLFKVARNAIYDTYGKKEPLPLDSIEAWHMDDGVHPETIVMQELNAERLRQYVIALSPDQQDVIALRFGQQLTLQETADILGKNVNTIKALQFRAVSRLRDMLERNKGSIAS